MKPFLIGLTGGVACGKTVAAEYLAELGACIVDADRIGREMVEIPEVQTKLQKFWPQAFDPAGLNRKALREIIFFSQEEREKLNRLLHPLILQGAIQEINRCQKPVCFFVAPLLIETGFYEKTDQVWVIDTPRETQIERLMQRDRVSREGAERVVDCQLPSEKKLMYSDFTIRNDGSLEKLKQQVREGWERVREKRP